MHCSITYEIRTCRRFSRNWPIDWSPITTTPSSSSWREAISRCNLPPKRSVPSQLESISHRYSRVPADLMDPCGERWASSAPPVGWWPDAVLSFATGLEDLVCWNIIGESGNVTEQSKPSIHQYRTKYGIFMYDKTWSKWLVLWHMKCDVVIVFDCVCVCSDGHAVCTAGAARDQGGSGSSWRDVAEKSRHAMYPQLEWWDTRAAPLTLDSYGSAQFSCCNSPLGHHCLIFTPRALPSQRSERRVYEISVRSMNNIDDRPTSGPVQHTFWKT